MATVVIRHQNAVPFLLHHIETYIICCFSHTLRADLSPFLSLAIISLSLTLCPDTFMWHLTPAVVSPLPPPHLSDQRSFFLFTRHRPSEKGHVQRDNPPQAESWSLGLSALNGPSVWQALRRPSPQTVWHVWRPGPGVREEYSALSAPKSSLLKGTSQTEMVLRKHNVCGTFWQARKVPMPKIFFTSFINCGSKAVLLNSNNKSVLSLSSMRFQVHRMTVSHLRCQDSVLKTIHIKWKRKHETYLIVSRFPSLKLKSFSVTKPKRWIPHVCRC